MKRIIMQHVIKANSSGGPITGFNRLMNSNLKDKYQFVPLNQTFAPHGVNFSLLFDLYKQIRFSKPDIVHVRGLQSEGFYCVLAAKLAGCKVVLSVHGFYGDSIGISKLKRILFNYFIEPLTLKLADAVYCVCEYASKRKVILNNTRNNKGFIHNAAPDYSVYDTGALRKTFRDRYSIGRDDVVITTVSRITVDKGYPCLVQAIKMLKEDKNLRFFIVGDGDYLNTIREDLSEQISNKKVVLMGNQSEIHSILLGSDIFAFPTLHENLSNALLEACAASLPCIATNVGGNPEIITHGDSGILVNPDQPLELMESIRKLSDSALLRENLGTKAKKKMKEKFGEANVFPKISDIYESLLTN